SAISSAYPHRRREACSFHSQTVHVSLFVPFIRRASSMAQPDRNSQKENKPRGNEPSFNWRGVVLIAIAFALIGLAVLFRGGAYANFEDVPYNRFLELLADKQIVTDKNYPLQLVVEEGRPTQTLKGYYLKQGVGPSATQQVPFRTTIFLNYNTDLQERLAKANIQP